MKDVQPVTSEYKPMKTKNPNVVYRTQCPMRRLFHQSKREHSSTDSSKTGGVQGTISSKTEMGKNSTDLSLCKIVPNFNANLVKMMILEYKTKEPRLLLIIRETEQQQQKPL